MTAAAEQLDSAVVRLIDDREQQGFGRTVDDRAVVARVATILATIRLEVRTP